MFEYGYNAQGRLATLTYPQSTGGYRLKLEYAYQHGELLQVRDASATTVFWQANSTDARGHVVDEQLGNGVQTVRGYDAVSGLPDYVQSGLGGAIQNYSYAWDAVGNLTQRQDVRQGLSERFGYDDLHRLTTVTGPEPMDLTYDARGNILSQTGPVRHGASHTVSWTSANLPRLISGPSGYSSEFFYTPDRSRWKQQAQYNATSETTLYLGGLLEKVTLGTTTAWKHFIQGAQGTIALYTRQSSGTNELHYLTKDHLGSVTAITGAAGAVEVRLSYAPFGRRRNERTWSGNPSSTEWSGITSTTRHGFTGHEMLDNLDLTHMNGRVYDQRVGRFLSADPYIDGAFHTQGWNRYAYVKNNPLSAFDPSGFGEEDTATDCTSSEENPDCNEEHDDGGEGGAGQRPQDRPGTGDPILGHVETTGSRIPPPPPPRFDLSAIPFDPYAGSTPQVQGHGGGGGGGAKGKTQSDKCYRPFSPGDSFAGEYLSRLGSLIAGLADSVSAQGSIGLTVGASANAFGLARFNVSGTALFDANLSLSGAGHLNLYAKVPTPGNLTFGEANVGIGNVSVGKFGSYVTDGVSTRYGPYETYNDVSAEAKLNAWRSGLGKVSASAQLGFGAKIQIDFAAALRALDCAMQP